MRVRKKPDLRIDIPSYPRDYVEMPAETRKKIEEAIRNSISPSVDDINTSSTSNVDDPDGVREGTRTPEVRIVGPEDVTVDDKKEDKKEESKDEALSADSPVVYRKAINEEVTVKIDPDDSEKITAKDVLNVSYLIISTILLYSWWYSWVCIGNQSLLLSFKQIIIITGNLIIIRNYSGLVYYSSPSTYLYTFRICS